MRRVFLKQRPCASYVTPAAFGIPSKRISCPQNRSKSTQYPRAKLKVELVTIGKRSGKDAAYDSPIEEYTKRMSRTLTVTERTVKPDAAAATVSNMREKGSVMLLDEKGRMPRDSIHFAEIVYDALEQGGSRLGVVIGGAEGLPKDVVAIGKENNVQLISLSPLTFTHKMARLFLYEQLYRATEIRANSSYHK